MTSKEALDNLINDYNNVVGNYVMNNYSKEINLIKQDLNRLEKLEKTIEILKRICFFEFEEETIYPQNEWDDCYVIYVTQFNNGFNKEEYDLLKEVLDNGK